MKFFITAPIAVGPATSYSYPSPSPAVKCPSNLLLSCQPSVAPVPCQQASQAHYPAPVPSYSAPPSYVPQPIYTGPSYAAPAKPSYSMPSTPTYSTPASPYREMESEMPNQQTPEKASEDSKKESW